ncbi:monofunctional biosynthetic peptidoglycan transglycosylase [Methylocapsa sp. D3K7]|uniref:monofunctional biosynthetic peptidoglycan transglycosylase n=1 Tax=Methylocapsa sp. D3K7 TaxID=3041435 RepID=UPI00244E7007|nr:monofunctional biosynthetic peptidoglycan transglycosylase [Methylocapsa sp. D3K7]WGJ13795.1 monofunctional biosynthetic peptidoglycan transglycosylase [Methylocapsa sp. D3K7]
MRSRSRHRGLPGTLFRATLAVLLALIFGVGILIVIYRFEPPVSTLMLARWLLDDPVERQYVPLDRISPSLRAAVLVSEDARFCQHDGVDWGALREVLDKAKPGGPSRGASTIPMQTAKNLFLWPSRSYIRKIIEIPLALLLDLAWSKRHILEVYLNIAEWGDGIFGAEAAARHYFHKSADRLDAREAALLATSLPSPLHRNAARPSPRHAGLAARDMAQARGADQLVACVK